MAAGLRSRDRHSPPQLRFGAARFLDLDGGVRARGGRGGGSGNVERLIGRSGLSSGGVVWRDGGVEMVERSVGFGRCVGVLERWP